MDYENRQAEQLLQNKDIRELIDLLKQNNPSQGKEYAALLGQMGYDPYVMIYEKPAAPAITRKLQRWVNNKYFFHAVKDFDDFDPAGWEKRKKEGDRI